MTSGSKIILTALAVAIVVAIAMWAIDVDVTGDVELPRIEANVEGGEMPDVDVDTADVDVGMEEGNVAVPSDIEVETTQTEIPYPTIDVEGPEEDTLDEQDDLDNLTDEQLSEEDDR